MPGDTEYRRGRTPMEIADEASGRAPARPESRKSKWERAGMTRAEYERGIAQLADERRADEQRRDRLDRTRRGQSNPGN